MEWNFNLPRSRGSDPQTSHEAEKFMRERGYITKQQDLIRQIVSDYPGMTAREIDFRFTLNGVAHRRLVELLRKGIVKRGEPRTCKVGRRKAHTWEVVTP